ncbi:MAG TPA: acetate/propionate family kinase [Candidatus Scatomorpha merdigallinarum]|nr:acetate/propionate family kinase [Candidatus Scatomorpha merdigallinarum]
MKILVSNVGSTSLKFKLYDMPSEAVLCEAKIERVGSDHDAIYSYKDANRDEKREGCSVPGYTEGIRLFLTDMSGVCGEGEIAAVGFKTVLAKGYYGIHELTDKVIAAMREYLFVAPAHNGPYLEAIGCFREIMPGARLVGVFETAFHTTIPPERTLYSLPYEWYERYGIKRMGYHGASHSYVADTLKSRYGSTGRSVSCHLGGSCSLCAIEDGRSVDTSFGFSLQTGVMHANRAGDIDSYIVPYLLNEGISMDEILYGLSKNGGLLGVSGVSNDLRMVLAAADEGNERAKLAVDMFVNQIVKYAGAFTAELGGLDNLVFTGGIGENSVAVRERVCSALSFFGLELDSSANNAPNSGVREISSPNSRVRALVIPANEELGIARRSYELIS